MEKLNDEQRKLIEDNYKLIRFLYRRSYTRVCSWEVFQDLGHDAICKAALGYDSSKGKFSTYFTWKIKSEIGHYLRSINYDVRKANDGAVSLFTQIGDDHKKKTITKLPDRTKKMVQLTYEGYGREEVDKELNVSRSLVSTYIVDFKKSMGY